MEKSRAHHPQTMQLVKDILEVLGSSAKFIDLRTHDYRVKLGKAFSDKETQRAIAKLQRKIDKSPYAGSITIKEVGSKYNLDIGFVVPFID